MKAIVVKRYKKRKEYERDATRMLRKGYETQSVVSEQPSNSVKRLMLLGALAVLKKPKPVLVVTYRKI